jgi:hypothetical protein
VREGMVAIGDELKLVVKAPVHVPVTEFLTISRETSQKRYAKFSRFPI